MRVALSPGPFHVDAAAFAHDNHVDFYYTVSRAQRRFAQDGEVEDIAAADHRWSFPSRVDWLGFSPDGRRLAAAMFQAASIVVLSPGDTSSNPLELSEPIAGAGLAGCRWPFRDWIAADAQFGLHLSLWNPSPRELEPDRVSRPRRRADAPREFVVAFLPDDNAGSGDLIALAHGERDVSIFTCTRRGQRWRLASRWVCAGVEELAFVDPARVLAFTDPLGAEGGRLLLKRVGDGHTLAEVGRGGLSAFGLHRGSRRVVCCGARERAVSVYGVGSKKVSELELEYHDPGVLSHAVEWNVDGSWLAILGLDDDESHGWVVKRDLGNFSLNNNKGSRKEVTLDVRVEDFIGFRWEPSVGNRLIIVLKKMIILWGASSPEILSQVENSNATYRDAVWNSIGNMLIVTFEASSHEAPLLIRLEE